MRSSFPASISAQVLPGRAGSPSQYYPCTRRPRQVTGRPRRREESKGRGGRRRGGGRAAPPLDKGGPHAICIASEQGSPVAQSVERVGVNPPYGGFESSPGSHSTRRSPVWRGSRHVRQSARARIQSSRQGGGRGGFGEAPRGVPGVRFPRLTWNGLHAIYIASECRSPVAQSVERVAVNH